MKKKIQTAVKISNKLEKGKKEKKKTDERVDGGAHSGAWSSFKKWILSFSLGCSSVEEYCWVQRKKIKISERYPA